MTMQVPAVHDHHQHHHHHPQQQQQQNLSNQYICGGGYGSWGGSYSSGEFCLASNHHHHMAAEEDESRTNSVTNEEHEHEEEEEEDEAAGSSSKDAILHHEHNRDEQGWLQLGIGTHIPTHQKSTNQTGTTTQAAYWPNNSNLRNNRQQSGGLVELDLLQGGRRPESILPYQVPEFRVPRPIPNSFSTSSSSSSPMFLQHQAPTTSYTTFFPQQQQYHNQEFNWALRPILPQNTMVSSSSSPFPSGSLSSFSTSLIPMGSYFARPYQLQTGLDVAGSSSSSDIRVIDPPPRRRQHSGIWFMLQASPNQAKEPFLPQISKSYIRIKDGRMTVRLLMKYLVNKLRLDSESEVEIRCRGQELQPYLTLQHVRDNIWSSRDAAAASSPLTTLLPDSSTTDHVMVLRYGRTHNTP